MSLQNQKTLWSGEEIAAVVNGICHHEFDVFGISTDSRSIQKGELFIALKGPHFDGHKFVEEAFENGAYGAIVDKNYSDIKTDLPLIIVEDTFTALQDLGHGARMRTHATMIGVTGSVGKTTVKEMLATALSEFGHTHYPKSSLNNHWGVPLTLARLPQDSDYAVIEMGMNHPHEIEPLSKLVAPEIAIITNVSAVHIENFNTISEIAMAKAEIFRGMSPDGTAILNRDNAYFGQILAEARTQGITKIYSFGEHEDADAKLLEYTSQESGGVAKAEIRGKNIEFQLSLPGKHQAINAISVLLIADILGLDILQASKTLLKLQPIDRRGKKFSVTLPNNKSVTVIDDTFNASPVAVRAAINVLKSTKNDQGRRIVALGDMLELGEFATDLHQSLAKDLNEDIDLVLTCGPLMKNCADLLPKNKVHHYTNSVEMANNILEKLEDKDIVLIKGSKSSLMDLVVKKIIKSDIN